MYAFLFLLVLLVACAILVADFASGVDARRLLRREPDLAPAASNIVPSSMEPKT
jgi:hypothetical protein